MGWRKTCAFWMNGLTKTQTGLILQKATHLDIIRGNVWPLMLMKKKFFLLPRTKNSYFTKERLSAYAIKRKGLWSKNLSTSQYNTQMLRKKHNGFQHSRIHKICHPCTDILSVENTWGSTPNLIKNSTRSKSFRSEERRIQQWKMLSNLF